MTRALFPGSDIAEPLAGRVRARQVAAVKRLTPITVAANLATSTLLVLSFSSSPYRLVLLAWFVANCLLSLVTLRRWLEGRAPRGTSQLPAGRDPPRRAQCFCARQPLVHRGAPAVSGGRRVETGSAHMPDIRNAERRRIRAVSDPAGGTCLCCRDRSGCRGGSSPECRRATRNRDNPAPAICIRSGQEHHLEQLIFSCSTSSIRRKLEEAARTDPLTGLMNRAGLRETLEEACLNAHTQLRPRVHGPRPVQERE